MNHALLESAHIMRPSPASIAWHASPGTVLQQIHALSEQVQAIAERDILRSYGLDLRAWMVLRALHRLGSATQRQVVAATGLDKVAVNRAASSLKKQHLVITLPNEDDGRSHYLELTRQGEDVLDRCGLAIAKLEREMLGGLTEGESWQFLEAIQKLQKALAHRA